MNISKHGKKLWDLYFTMVNGKMDKHRVTGSYMKKIKSFTKANLKMELLMDVEFYGTSIKDSIIKEISWKEKLTEKV